jgi:hypothetical protein
MAKKKREKGVPRNSQAWRLTNNEVLNHTATTLNRIREIIKSRLYEDE